MKSKTKNLLLSKIEELHNYAKQQSNNESKDKLDVFLDDLKSIEPNLSMLSILNHLVAMYNEGYTTEQIYNDVKRTKKMFHLANQYVQSLGLQNQCCVLADQIHHVIIQHLEGALEVYLNEYDIS